MPPLWRCQVIAKAHAPAANSCRASRTQGPARPKPQIILRAESKPQKSQGLVIIPSRLIPLILTMCNYTGSLGFHDANSSGVHRPAAWEQGIGGGPGHRLRNCMKRENYRARIVRWGVYSSLSKTIPRSPLKNEAHRLYKAQKTQGSQLQFENDCFKGARVGQESGL